MMSTSETPGGRERRKHPRYELRKSVRVFLGDLSHSGALIDVSVGGAAIECRAAIEDEAELSVEIEELGTYPAELVRRIDQNVIAVKFIINEAVAVRLAARIAVTLHGQQNERGAGIGLETIELVPGSS